MKQYVSYTYFCLFLIKNSMCVFVGGERGGERGGASGERRESSRIIVAVLETWKALLGTE